MAARSDQPVNTPRIVEVQNPGTNTYAVMVLMPTQLASKYPDKPWGTAIDAIGLAKKDSDLYPGYVLVDFEPMKGSADLFWIFQNLDTAPAWTTKSLGQESLIPQKYRRLVTTVRTKQEVDPATEPTAITGDLTSSVVEQQDNTGKAIRVNTTEVIDESADPLVGEEYGEIVTKSVSESMVAEGTPADTGLDIISSTVEAIGNGKSIKQTKRVKGGAWPDPVEQEASKEVPDLIPGKFRKSVVRSKKTKKVSSIPGTITVSGDETGKVYKRETPDRVEETTITETIDSNAEALAGEEYGDIVTKSVEEQIVNDGTAADTGLDVISSVVSPLGNGKSVKETKRVKGAWEDPLDREVTKDGNDTPPARYRKNLTRTKVTRKIATASIPTDPTLTGNEVGKSYKKETPDRAEETVTTEVFDLNTAAVDEAIEQKPFVTIKSVMTPGAAPAVPTTGNGSAKLVYDGATKIYENIAEVATPRAGRKGVETNAQQWGQLISTTDYTTSSDAPNGGSVNLIYNDGAVAIYEATTTSVGVTGSSKDIDPQSWGKLTWEGVYGTTTSGDKSRQVWSNGVTSVFLNETATLTVSGSSKDIDPQSWGKITWSGEYATSTGGDKSRQVYTGPGGSVFLNETAVNTVSGSSKDIDAQSWGSVTWNGEYATGTGGVKSRQVYSGPGGAVYLNETPTVTTNGTSIDLDSHEWGQVRWNGVFASTPSGDRSKQVWSMGGVQVYLNETAELIVNSGSFVSAKESNPVLTETQTSSYGQSAVSGGNSRSRVVFSVGTKTVYENITIERTPKAARVYPGSVNVDIPPVFGGLKTDRVSRRDGGDSFIFTPQVTAGYRGPMPCEITETWSDSPSVSVTATIFRPSGMSFDSPLGGFSVGPCLHGTVSGSVTVGSNHKLYHLSSYAYSFEPSTPATMPGNFIAHVDSQPYRDGYITRVYKVTLG